MYIYVLSVIYIYTIYMICTLFQSIIYSAVTLDRLLAKTEVRVTLLI